MNLLSRMPIKYQLRLIVVIMALPVVGMIINAGMQQREDALNAARIDTQKLADRIAYEQQNRNASARQLMVALSQLREIQQKDTAKVTPILSEILKLNPDFSNIFVADRSGTVWATAVPVRPPFIVSDRRYFKNALASGKLSTGEHVISRATSRPTFNLSYPIKDKHGTIIGIISVGFLLEKYAQILEKSKLPYNSSFTLLDHKGVILFRPIDPIKFIGKPVDPVFFKQIQELPDDDTGIGTSVVAGDKRIISTRKLRLEGEPSPYMYIRTGIPVASVLSNANMHLIKNLMLLSGVLVLTFFFSSFIGKYSIVSRINLLENASHSFANGDYQIRVAELVQGGELGRLAESFDSMADKLIQREKALIESEFFFKESQRAASIGSYKADFVKGRWESSEVLDSILGIDKMYDRSIQGWLDIVYSNDRDMMSQYLHEEVISKRKPFAKEYRITRNNDGETRWVYGLGEVSFDAHGNVLSLFGTIQDITERKQTEEGLFLFKESVDNSTDAIGMATPEGKHIYQNKSFTDMFDEFGDNPPNLFVDTSIAQKMFQTILAGEQWSGEVKMYGKKGAVLDIHLRAYANKDADGRIIGLVGIHTDITERKLAEEERENMAKQLLHTQKLESLGVLAGGIAHDFNNILMTIIGNADLALMRINKESPATENLRRVEQAAARAADLAKQMLAYSGKGKFVIESIDLNHLLEDMLHMLEVSISKKAVLRLNLTRPLPSVEADSTQLRQIIMNLVINASEAIGDISGVIAISTGYMDCDKNYLRDVWLEENLSEGLFVYFEISDTGCGMDKETVLKIFDPFFTTKFTGRGLGMAAVLGIVRGHKGAIKVYSEPKKGTTFKILLPASDRPIEISNSELNTDDWKGSGTVLLVDDEETVRGIGKEMLQELGYSVITAEDGRMAINIFKSSPGIAFVILDLTMPHIDGEQCFRELKQINPSVKVIMSSGYNEQEVNQKFVGKGLAGFIQKPYKLSVLKEAIRKI
jgi:two-component system, cell cycle sensor histidine kinase and response regulator CckA